MLAPLTKPKFKTSVQCDQFDVFEVELVTDAPKGSRFNPRPRVAYDGNDAILALAEMVKDNGLTPGEFLAQIPESVMCIFQSRLLSFDGKMHQCFRIKAGMPHSGIVQRLGEYFSGAQTGIGTHTMDKLNVQESEDDAPRMVSMLNSGSQSTTQRPGSPKPPPKERRLITVQGGGGESKQDQLRAMVEQLTPENIPAGGLVLTMGKNGPRMLKTASARTDEEENEAFLDSEESGVTIREHDHSSAELVLPAKTPSPKTNSGAGSAVVKTARTMTADQLDTMARSSSVETHRPQVYTATGEESNMGSAQAAAMIDSELGGGGFEDDQGEIEGPLLPVTEGERTNQDISQSDNRNGHRVKKQEGIIKKGRGGSRPGSTR